MNTKRALESLSMDLKRVALGYNRGSENMAKRFSEEAVKRKNEIDPKTIKPYLKRLLDRMEQFLQQDNKKKAAEDSLMLSTLFQNYTQTFF